MEIIVKGRNVEIPEHYRQHVTEKLARLERYDHKLLRLDVELFHERNPRQAASCQRVEITGSTRGQVVRAEATAKDFYSALDIAIGKLESRMRRAADRRRVHHGRRTPISVAEATTRLITQLESELGADGHQEPGERLPGQIVRMKEHTAKPITVDDALFEMELVGHDFYLFNDVDTGRPSVVYRRKGYDYGLISLTD
ncbi:MAG: ribosome-associated translation inhibitor RaiA [Corynebacteriales bacterium]|nr:ribosome-associated translation inhibitor RaiA [Mycobacteriales bacterium]